MNPYRLPAILALAAFALGLPGCVEHVDTIVADKQGFLKGNFSATTLDSGVAATLEQAGAEAPAGYSRMEFSSVPVSVKTGRPGRLRLKVSLHNEGNGLSSRLTETLQNGVPISQYYELTYRGYLPLRWNFVALYEEVAPVVWEVRRFDRFDPLRLDATDPLHYDYTTGSTQLGRSSWEHDSCIMASRTSAAGLNPGLQGEAQIFDCEFRNQRIAARTTEWAYLLNYGVAVEVSADLDGGKMLYPIQDLKIE